MENIISIMIFLPAAAAVILIFLPKEMVRLFRFASLGVSLSLLIPCIYMIADFALPYDGKLRLIENYKWIDGYGISYLVGVDGISVFLVVLTVLMGAIAIISSWKAIEDKVKEFSIAMLLMISFMIGAFCALDLILFYLFFEAMLIPMYLLIGIWGGPKRIYAAVKFFIYTMVGSLLMLIAILFLYYLHYRQFGFFSMNILHLYQTTISPVEQIWLFCAFALAFAIKVPLFPFHTWLPDAHVEAPTSGSVILAAILLKFGGYGFIRFAIPIFPDAAYLLVPWIVVMSILGIIYGSMVAMVQPDVKKLVAYSSVAHMGFVMIGIFSFTTMGVEGGVYQMLNHGISTGALFLLVGVLYERSHTRLIEDYGGVASRLPVFAMMFMIITLSSIGLPGMNGFVGEFLILLGMFKSGVVEGARVYTVLAATGIVLGAVYMLWMYQRIFFGEVTKDKVKELIDMNLREIVYMIPILVLVFFMGIYPRPILNIIEPSAEKIMVIIQTKGLPQVYDHVLEKEGKLRRDKLVGIVE